MHPPIVDCVSSDAIAPPRAPVAKHHVMVAMLLHPGMLHAGNSPSVSPAMLPVKVELSSVTAEESAVYTAPPVVLPVFCMNCELMIDRLAADA